MHEELNQQLKSCSAREGLASIASRLPGKVVFTTSFSLEDQVIFDLLMQLAAGISPVRIVTLDTGRLFEESYKVFNQTRQRYKYPVEVYSPDAEELEALISKKGPYSFYETLENRKECCNIRKVVPLKRALQGADCWITGIRAAHSPNRQNMPAVEYDEANDILKYHPLLNWSIEQVRAYINEKGIPYNILHDRGYPSIGCAPCTRAVAEGADPRSGRWWWEQGSGKECGLHAVQKEK